MSWEQFKQKFFAFIDIEKEPATVARYKLAIKYLEEIKHFKYLHEITPNILQALKENLLNQKKGVAGVNRTIKAIKAMMHQAGRFSLWVFLRIEMPFFLVLPSVFCDIVKRNKSIGVG